MTSSAVEHTLLATVEAGVLTLTLNRPDRRNAIDPDLRDALAAALDRAAAARERQDPIFRGQ
jgi:enoyl-CoA hydratase/carnithine racemase